MSLHPQLIGILSQNIGGGGGGGEVVLDPELGDVTFLAGFESANENEIVAVGGTGTAGTLSSAQAKFGSQSLLLSGAVESVYSVTEPFTGIDGNPTFVVEAWIYLTENIGIGENRTVLKTDDDSVQLMIWQNPGDFPLMVPAIIVGGIFVPGFSTSPVSSGQWHHVVWAYSSGGGVAAVAVDGVRSGQNAEITANTSGHTSFSLGGTYPGPDGPPASAFQGYLDEVRISTGVLRYGGSAGSPLPDTFDVPTEAFPRVGNLISDPTFTGATNVWNVNSEAGFTFDTPGLRFPTSSVIPADPEFPEFGDITTINFADQVVDGLTIGVTYAVAIEASGNDLFAEVADGGTVLASFGPGINGTVSSTFVATSTTVTVTVGNVGTAGTILSASISQVV